MKRLILFLPLLLAACDHGIEPKPEQFSGFSGEVTFINEWPDSIKRTHIVIFKNPLLVESDFVLDNLRFISQEISFGVSTYEFSSLDQAIIPASPGAFEPGDYAYVSVAHQSTETISLVRKDWYVSGIYYANGDTTKPGILTVPADRMIENINIICDFDNPPPQPPGGK